MAPNYHQLKSLEQDTKFKKMPQLKNPAPMVVMVQLDFQQKSLLQPNLDLKNWV
jgi:hypothetical protein